MARRDAPSRRARRSLALLSAGLGLGGAHVSGQREPVYSGVDLVIDSGTISGYSLSVRAHTPVQAVGEAFFGLDDGWGGSAAFTAFFGARYEARVRLGASRFDDYDHTPATALESSGELLWPTTLVGVEVAGGMAVGFTRLSRPVFESTQNGFLVGATGGVRRGIGERWAVLADMRVAWSSFRAPDFAIPPPEGFPDEGAYGRRLLVGLGLEYRWGEPPSPGQAPSPPPP